MDPSGSETMVKKFSKRWLEMTYMNSGVVRLETGSTQAPTVLIKGEKHEHYKILYSLW
jgi:hypothetical protein